MPRSVCSYLKRSGKGVGVWEAWAGHPAQQQMTQQSTPTAAPGQAQTGSQAWSQPSPPPASPPPPCRPSPQLPDSWGGVGVRAGTPRVLWTCSRTGRRWSRRAWALKSQTSHSRSQPCGLGKLTSSNSSFLI